MFNRFCNWLKRQPKKTRTQCHQINVAGKTLLIIRMANDHSDAERLFWVEDFSQRIYEWLDDERTPILVLCIDDMSGVEIALEKIE